MTQIRPRRFEHLGTTIEHGDFLEVSRTWPDPTVIVSDGAYGIGSFPGDPTSAHDLPEWYEPHILEWSKRAIPETTLWFWNTELGWATIHPLLLASAGPIALATSGTRDSDTSRGTRTAGRSGASRWSLRYACSMCARFGFRQPDARST